MPTVDLTAPPAPTTALAAAPRRVGLTLPEIHLVAATAGDAPLPFQMTDPAPLDAMESRLGASPHSLEDQAYRSALASMYDPADSLQQRGLLVDGRLDDGLAGAVGLLATPEVALDLDLAQGGVQAKAWHRQSGGAVATLATADGLVFELAWFGTDAWPAELGRVAVISEDVAQAPSAVPPYLDLPYELVDSATEAIRTGRGDLVPVLVARHPGSVSDAAGRVLADADVSRALTSLAAEARGRLRCLVADVSGEQLRVAGVISWTLLSDGWRALRPHRGSDGLRVELRAVGPEDLPAVVAPVLAEAER